MTGWDKYYFLPVQTCCRELDVISPNNVQRTRSIRSLYIWAAVGFHRTQYFYWLWPWLHDVSLNCTWVVSGESHHSAALRETISTHKVGGDGTLQRHRGAMSLNLSSTSSKHTSDHSSSLTGPVWTSLTSTAVEGSGAPSSRSRWGAVASRQISDQFLVLMSNRFIPEPEVSGSIVSSVSRRANVLLHVYLSQRSKTRVLSCSFLSAGRFIRSSSSFWPIKVNLLGDVSREQHSDEPEALSPVLYKKKVRKETKDKQTSLKVFLVVLTPGGEPPV